MSNCGDCTESPPRKATKFCKDHSNTYCDPCYSLIHQGAKASHHSIPIEEYVPPSSSSTAACGEHPQEKLDLFCTQCKEPVCRNCPFTVKHTGHTCLLVGEVTKILLKEVNDVAEKLTLKKKTIESASSVLEALILSTKKEGEEQVKQVNEHFASIIKAAEDRRNEMLSLVSKSLQSSVEQLENQNQDFKNFSGEVSEALNQIKEWSSQSDPSLVAKDHPALISKIEDATNKERLFVPNLGLRFRPQLDGSLIPIIQSHGNLVPTLAALETQVASLTKLVETEAKEGGMLLPGFPASSPACEEHPSQTLNLLCLEEDHENELVCALCISTGDHKGHNNVSVAEQQPKLIPSIEKKIQKLHEIRQGLLVTVNEFLSNVNAGYKEMEATTSALSDLSSCHREIAAKKGDLTNAFVHSLDLEKENIEKVLSNYRIRARQLFAALQNAQELTHEKDPVKFATGYALFKDQYVAIPHALKPWSNADLHQKLEAINGRLKRVTVNPTVVTLDDIAFTKEVDSDIPVGYPETLYSGCVLVPSKREIWSISYNNWGELNISHLEKKEVEHIKLPFSFQCSYPLYDGKEHVYIHEGCFGTRNRVVKVNINTRAIEELTPSPREFSYYGSYCIQGGKLWAFAQDSLFTLDLNTNTWQDGVATNLPENPMLLATPAQPDYIYLLKGALHRFTISTKTIEQISTKPGSFSWNGDGTSAILLSSGVLVSEGGSEEGGWEAYSIHENRWIKLSWFSKVPFFGTNLVYDEATKSFYYQVHGDQTYKVVKM